MFLSLLERLARYGERQALIWHDRSISYADLVASARAWSEELRRLDVAPGEAVAICGDCSPQTCALLFALVANENIVVPLSSVVGANRDRFMEIAEVRHALVFDAEDRWEALRFERTVTHPLLTRLRDARTPGLILFSSGSTGESKASVLDFSKLIGKFGGQREAARTLVFLLLDHIGGINTLLHVLSAGGTIVAIADRSPEAVVAAIERHAIEVLPTTPTFLNMLLISQAHSRYDLSSLRLVTYGTEPMPASTLSALRAALPNARLKQTYGLSELGILPTKSRDSGSLWVKLGSDGFEHKIVDGKLWIRSDFAMSGYLNAPAPFDDEGYFDTQDQVEVDGEWIRILGRASEIINVGGQKVYPGEVESVLLELDNIRDATVIGVPNPVTGQVVTAAVSLVADEDAAALRRRIQAHCRTRLEPYKIPLRIEVHAGDHHSARFKKSRRAVAGATA